MGSALVQTPITPLSKGIISLHILHGSGHLHHLASVHASDHLHHLARLVELFHQSVHILNLGARTLGYAQAAALALIDTELSAEEIVKKAMDIAADICIYTNHNIVMEKL